MKTIKKAKHTGELTIKHYAARGKMSAYLKVHCFCCPSSAFKIYLVDPKDKRDDLVEMAGVIATKKEWREVMKLAGI